MSKIVFSSFNYIKNLTILKSSRTFNCLHALLYILIVILFLGCAPKIDERIGLVDSVEMVNRGDVLVNGFAACGFCHSKSASTMSPLSGGLRLVDVKGDIISPNITPSRTGTGLYTPTDFFNLFRKYTKPDSSNIGIEHHLGYEWMSDRDLLSIIAYIRSLRPISKSHPKRDTNIYSFADKIFQSDPPKVSGAVPEVKISENSSKIERLSYGRYLAKNVARCHSCHDGPNTLFSAGSPFEGGKVYSRNKKAFIVPSLVAKRKKITSNKLMTYLSKLNIKRVKKVKGCPKEFFTNAPLKDREMLVEYIMNTLDSKK